ncbi:major facilitator superfamily domain-containing protein [Armillaria borealis]|uniref:Major facilitator superfamily domain-containing protein n=1 Tax=Armillaria borealis TaxID=47425 RepID=A0AA39MJ24_9AGAR|nr:major facilitator superfamily domain-containing protein [Armillaria borealis]
MVFHVHDITTPVQFDILNSWIRSFNAFLLISGGVVAGRLYDCGHFYPLLYGGCLLTVFSLFMLSLAKPDHYYQVFLTHGLSTGISGGLTYVPSVVIISQYFSKKRALAMMIIASGASFSTIIHPLMLNSTLTGHLGFGNAVRASAGLEGGLLLITCLIMRTRIPVEKKASVGSKNLLRHLWADWAYVFTVFGLLVFSIGFYFPQFYLQLDATTHNLNKDFLFYSVSHRSIIYEVFSFPALTCYFELLQVDNMITVAMGICAAVVFGMIGLSSIASVVLIAIFYGFFAGSFVALTGPVLVLLSTDLSELGVRMGIAYFFSGTPIGGALLTQRYIWWRPAVFSAVSDVQKLIEKTSSEGSLVQITSLVGSASFVAMVLVLHY